jgi:hypothetical protein
MEYLNVRVKKGFHSIILIGYNIILCCKFLSTWPVRKTPDLPPLQL